MTNTSDKLAAALEHCLARAIGLDAFTAAEARDALAAFEASGPDATEAGEPATTVTTEQLQRWADRFAKMWEFKFATEVCAALATPPLQEPLCHCKDRPASQCTEEWGPECDLGNNPAHAKTAPREFEDQLNASVLQEQDKRDAARWRAMRELFVAFDWQWNEPPIAVAMFELKSGIVSAGPEGADELADAAVEWHTDIQAKSQGVA